MTTRIPDRGRRARRAAVRCVASLAGACQYLGRLNAAERLLEIALHCSPAPDAQRIAMLNRLGVVLKTNGRYDDAEACYAQVHTALYSSPDSAADARAVLHHNLAGLAYARGEYEDAEREIRTALAIPGRCAAARAADKGLLGAVFAARGRHEEAGAVLRRVLSEMEQLHGPSHYEVAVVLQNLAALDQRRDPLQAEQLYERALRIKRRRLGRTHPEVGVLLNNLATLHSQQQRDELALAQCTEARNILRRRYGPQHPATQRCEQNLRRISELTPDPRVLT
jgi:tetratricopeptide (TPR) repeat protein